MSLPGFSVSCPALGLGQESANCSSQVTLLAGSVSVNKVLLAIRAAHLCMHRPWPLLHDNNHSQWL